MKLLKSTRGIPIPKLYFVTDRKNIKDIPKGVPYIYGDEEDEECIVRIMEYEVLYQRAVKTGYPFDFKSILTDNGFDDIEDFGYTRSDLGSRLNLVTEGDIRFEDVEDIPLLTSKKGKNQLRGYIKDCSVYVDISAIKALNIFPTWLSNIEDAVSSNIHNFASFDHNMYNKKLEGMYGGLTLKSPDKNLIVIDISSSIPKAVSATTLALAKNLSENFYADILITGSKSTLYDYSEIEKLDVRTIYNQNGMDNDQVYFKDLLTKQERQYNTAIVFGDDHTPGFAWSNYYNEDTKTISKEDGKKLCKWKINKLISFHTYSEGERVAGYADWFTPESTEHITDWVKDLRRR